MTTLIVFPPPPTAEEMIFRTYRAGYLEAVRMGIAVLCPHDEGFLPGVAAAVHGGRWQGRTRAGRTLSARAGQFLRRPSTHAAMLRWAAN